MPVPHRPTDGLDAPHPVPARLDAGHAELPAAVTATLLERIVSPLPANAARYAGHAATVRPSRATGRPPPPRGAAWPPWTPTRSRTAQRQ
ncbi:hypothetical protein [Streptomyces sp. DSM 15324]|uniref:hypothetical protein n=1 Tax=Streptomyces sp. DSM 15324 TaxID=1739111 RepID=UPI00074810FD|nr:hypothetical protein [Streptomyces sp. DSM 15324]KUO09900.1 hypothetical protein AQJ58_22975 [Streptomyces sp. DSM 15324]